MNKPLLLTTLALAIIVFYFTGAAFSFSILEQTIAATAAFLLFLSATVRGMYQYFVTTLAAFSVSLSLGCAFLNVKEVTGPFVVNLTLNPWLIIIFSALVAGGAWLWQEKGKSKKRFAAIMLWLFVLNWIILAVNVKFYDDWKMENWLTVPFVIVIYLTHRWFKLSNLSYGLIFLFMMLHIYGSHYTYSDVPFGFWLQDVFDAARNHYDRIVHFSFGLLLAYPIREIIVRISDTKGFWGYWFPVEFVLAFSAIYELMEWGIAVIFGGDLGVAYLGTQGDVWDAQKDMFLAGLGSFIAMSIIALIVWYYRRSDFWREFWESFSVKRKEALGEEALKKMRR